jgi:hypothetical protein
MATAWWCYRQRAIRLADLRVWFAAWEMRSRRCLRPAPLPRRFGLVELARLTGLSTRRLTPALRRLQDARLLDWSESAIEFPAPSEALAGLDALAFRRFLDGIPNRQRRVPVPRRVLRRLALGCRPALIATILGHLFRCLYVQGGSFQDVGRAKASWIADTFGVGLRRVKEARQELVADGWLIPLPSPQWSMNRWGALVRVNLEWSPVEGPSGEPELAPPALVPGPEPAPPESDKEPLRERKNQEPTPGGPSGFSTSTSSRKNTEAERRPAAPSTPPSTAGGRPDLRRVLPIDLNDTGRLLELYAQAVAEGLAAASEWGRLRFVAAAEHARAIGRDNPCGLFVRLVRSGWLHYASEGDETAASVRLRRHEQGGPMPAARPSRVASPPSRPRPSLSDDARLVQAVRAAAAQARYRGDPFPLLRRQQPEWTRERWDLALAELSA